METLFRITNNKSIVKIVRFPNFNVKSIVLLFELLDFN